MSGYEPHPDQYDPRRSSGSRAAAMKRAMDRKEQSIQKFVDAKNVGMTAFAAIRDSAALSVALVNTGAIKEAEYADKFDEYFYTFLEAYSDKLEDAQKFFDELKSKVNGRKIEQADRGKDEAEHDAGQLL